jgi:hypothetical protein
MANINVNVQYDYTAAILGSFSGGTLPPGTVVPHPVAVSISTGLTGDTVTDLSSITIGGFNGLNN